MWLKVIIMIITRGAACQRMNRELRGNNRNDVGHIYGVWDCGYDVWAIYASWEARFFSRILNFVRISGSNDSRWRHLCFNLLVAFVQSGTWWRLLPSFSLMGSKNSVWRLWNRKWRSSRHPKPLDNQTQTLQRQDITVIQKNSSRLTPCPLSFSQFGRRQPFFSPESQICVVLPGADRRLLQNTSNGSRRKPRVHCRLYLLEWKRNVNHDLCEKPQNSSLPSYNLNMNSRNWMLKRGENQSRLFMQTFLLTLEKRTANLWVF